VPSQEFTYTGTWKKWTVPAKVEWVEVVVEGAGSGSTPGGRVAGRINVKRINSLHVLVGQKGVLGGGPTTGGGGAAGQGRGLPDGFSGGGGSFIRSSSSTGAIKAVAGGAGGASGDGGEGGAGGGDVGEAGTKGPIPGEVGNATGGTQIQGGNGGRSAVGAALSGGSAGDGQASPGGAGGSSTLSRTWGGGGGGGGYRGGGGGQAGLEDQAPAGGGGGGSSFIGGLTGYTNTQAGGSVSNGRITLTWVSPPPANQPPTAPTGVKIGGDDYTEDHITLSRGRVKISAVVKDPDQNSARLVVVYSPDNTFRQPKTVNSSIVEHNKRASVTLEGLAQNTLWHARLYSRDKAGLLSRNYTSIKFWTNRSPNAPEPQSPGDNATISELDSVPFSWNHTDPDHPETPHQRAFNLRWRRAGTALTRPGPWIEVTYESTDETYVGEHADFKASTFYEWQVRTQDEQQLWGPFSEVRSFFVEGSTAPPYPVSPVGNDALDQADGVEFVWTFRDPTADAEQVSADLRYRRVGSDDWITLTGDPTYPGGEALWYLDPATLAPGHWEWEVRTTSTEQAIPSDWSDTARFWVVRTPGATTELVVPVRQSEARLGCADNEVHIYRRGGDRYVGHIKPVADLSYNRKRDDIGNLLLNTNGFGTDCGALLRDLHCWTHEAVVFRDGERVWEGPITRITDTPTGFHIEAKDVMGYVYRRIMRQGYNDAFRVLNNVQMGSRSVVQRARQIIMNALAPDDPNVLAYLTSLDYPDDARESRSVPDFSKTSWEEVDSLAATGGLDYSVAGRRIILNDTHRPIGRLPEMRTNDFSDPPVVSEYGMLLATDFAVTNNNGVFGLVSKRAEGEVGPYGIIEQLASAYGEEEGGGAVETLTSEAQANLEQVLTEQAERNIANRYPTPLIVRVPDNSTLMPTTPVRFNHLVPGVWIPLRAQGTIREVAQWQKLDVVSVTQTPEGEKVSVTMSPAPNGGADPDAEGAAVEGAE
jgi:hypothetical protein